MVSGGGFKSSYLRNGTLRSFFKNGEVDEQTLTKTKTITDEDYHGNSDLTDSVVSHSLTPAPL